MSNSNIRDSTISNSTSNIRESTSNPPKFAADLEAHVVGFGKRTHAKRKRQYAVYTVDVSLGDAQWAIQRRFSEFVKFNSNLKSAFPTLNFLQLPSRLHKSLDPAFLEKRRQRLNSFVIDVLDQVPLVVPILKCDIVMQFLEVMKHLEKHFVMDKRTKAREYFPDLYASFPFNKKTINLTIKHGMDKGEAIPIHMAAKEGNCDEVSAIIKAQPMSIATTDYLGQTALHIASRHGQAPVIRLLLVLGANRNTQDKRGWSPLHCACTSADLQSVLTLLEDEGVIPDLQNVDGNTPLHYFARYFGSLEATNMLKSVLTLFTRRGSDINTQNKSGETVLHHACWRGSLPLVALLVASGADPNILTANGESPLQWSVREGRANVMQFFVQLGSSGDFSLASSPWTPVTLPGSYTSLPNSASSSYHPEEPKPKAESDDYDEDDFDADDGSDSGEDVELTKRDGKRKAVGSPASSIASTSPTSISPSSSVSPSSSISPSSSVFPSSLSPSSSMPSSKFVLGSTPRLPPPTNPIFASPQRKNLQHSQGTPPDFDLSPQQSPQQITSLPQQSPQQEIIYHTPPKDSSIQDSTNLQEIKRNSKEIEIKRNSKEAQQQNGSSSFLDSPAPSPSTTPSVTPSTTPPFSPSDGFEAKYQSQANDKQTYSSSAPSWVSPSSVPNSLSANSAPASSNSSSSSVNPPPLALSPEIIQERQFNYLAGQQRLPKLDDSPDLKKEGEGPCPGSEQELVNDLDTLQVSEANKASKASKESKEDIKEELGNEQQGPVTNV